MTHLSETTLNELADDAVVAAELPPIEAHLAACAECTARLHALRAVRRALRALPRDLEPATDLLPGIHARIRGTRPSSARVRPLGPWSGGGLRWPWLAAAALVLVALSSAVTLLVVRGRDVPAQPDAAALPASAQLVDLRATEARYVDAIAELRAALLQDQRVLEPETVRLLEQSLATIDRALADARTALARDPANEWLAEMLQANYEKKLDLLRRASAHARARL